MDEEKSEILQDYEKEILKNKNLSFFNLLVAYIVIAVIFLLSVPTIYIRNEIYYISRDIASLSTEKSVLKEENRALNNKIEALNYKHEIRDPISILNEEK